MLKAVSRVAQATRAGDILTSFGRVRSKTLVNDGRKSWMESRNLRARFGCGMRETEGMPQIPKRMSSQVSTVRFFTQKLNSGTSRCPPVGEKSDVSKVPAEVSESKLGPVEINEEDIIETFVRGSGPGGQKINKTSSCVQLRHKPSGIVIRCQEGRSRHRNRELARKILRDRLDLAVRGEESRLAQEANRERARKAVKRKKAVKKHFKSRRDRSNML